MVRRMSPQWSTIVAGLLLANHRLLHRTVAMLTFCSAVILALAASARGQPANISACGTFEGGVRACQNGGTCESVGI
jgi:hypothetical protein